jgi:hypothetical protein
MGFFQNLTERNPFFFIVIVSRSPAQGKRIFV